MEKAEREGRIYFPPGGGVPREKRFLDEQEGTPVTSVWTDIPPVNARANERLGYPTQKPLPLLERVIAASSNEGDVILDPFCGCGTTVTAAHKLRRRWVGIDVSIHAVHVIGQRLVDNFGPSASPKAEGIPADYESACELARSNPFQFQWWANYLIGVHTINEVQKGADRGIDGEMFFPNGPGKAYGRILTFVKGGRNLNPAMVREFRGVLERERAEMGLFICLERPTHAMEHEAVVAGYANVVHGRIPRIQIVSIADWFSGDRPLLPPMEQLPYAAFSKKPRTTSSRRPDPNAPELPLSFSGGKAITERAVVRHLNPKMVVGTA
jgi:site-specific DNA-methyltransferase (adenine-specific)